MSAIAAYRALLRIVGPAYVVVAFLGRIPLAMSQLGVLVLVSTETGRYGVGGAAAGILAVANAIGSPLAGALADRVGQRPVVLVQSLVGAVGLVAVVLVTGAGAAHGIIFLAAGITGFAMPQVGPLARVRWRPITSDRGDQRRLVDAAFSYEGAADEASFVLGPALIGVLAIVAEPAGALVAAAVLLAVFGTWFAVHPTSALVAKRAATDVVGGSTLWTVSFVVLVFAQLCIGAIFGSVQTGTTVLADGVGQAGAAGLIHAVLGIGSVIAGLAVTALPERVLYATRMLVAATGLLVLSAPLLLVDSILSLVVVIALLGFAVAPYMISNFALAGILVPLHRVGTAMTLLAGATGIGYALGASLAGRLADDSGHRPAFAVTVAAAGVALVLALAANRTLREARPVAHA
ncbi:transporter, major facilitator family protein [Aeromicrobium marinum DSM 15272]|uniref:Transporter, major facilitator family protein n=1 Tax=Aeromicrobium marinum DSM 15272 TaxID=585531 RepID=E2SDC3_9ACTN|nr:MFS transporter [Aeromicrobium marinum]EFQ82500.1 transporter, major facilitator family protein [Aeromicrobium marinum DSM 15272]